MTKVKKKTSKKCTCGAGNKIACSKCSSVKMVILLKNGNDHLKLRNSNGKRNNPVWYSILSKDGKSLKSTVNAMCRRFLDSNKYASKANALNFYDNSTKELLTTVKL